MGTRTRDELSPVHVIFIHLLKIHSFYMAKWQAVDARSYSFSSTYLLFILVYVVYFHPNTRNIRNRRTLTSAEYL